MDREYFFPTQKEACQYGQISGSTPFVSHIPPQPQRVRQRETPQAEGLYKTRSKVLVCPPLPQSVSGADRARCRRRRGYIKHSQKSTARRPCPCRASPYTNRVTQPLFLHFPVFLLLLTQIAIKRYSTILQIVSEMFFRICIYTSGFDCRKSEIIRPESG